MQTVKSVFKLDEKDFLKYQYIAFTGSITRIIYVGMMFLLFIYLLIEYIRTGENFNLTAISGLAVFFYIATFVYYIPKTAIEKYNSSSFKNGNYEIEASEFGLRINRGNGNESSIPWDSFYTVWIKWGYYLFYITENNYIQLPKNRLNETENECLQNYIQTYVKPSKRRNPNNVNMIKNLLNMLLLIGGLAIIVLSILSFLGILR